MITIEEFEKLSTIEKHDIFKTHSYVYYQSIVEDVTGNNSLISNFLSYKWDGNFYRNLNEYCFIFLLKVSYSENFRCEHFLNTVEYPSEYFVKSRLSMFRGPNCKRKGVCLCTEEEYIELLTTRGWISCII